MKRIALLIAGLLIGGSAAAAGGATPYEFKPDPGNKASLQRGASSFTAYCSGCHSMEFMRHNRVAKDLGIPKELMEQYLMPPGAKPGDTMLSAMSGSSAKTWFGTSPPDLTLETRARGPSWVYSYLMTFYTDPSRPMGVNNLMLPGASMPHVLWQLQGTQVKAEHHEGDVAAGHGGGQSTGLELASEGSLSPKEYEAFVGDLVNFMAYAAEPGKVDRISVGKKAMVYLLVLLVMAYFLKKEFWKDVH